MTNSFEFRTIVTGRNEDGKSAFVSDEPTSELAGAALSGIKFWLTWRTPDDTTTTTGKDAQPFTFSPAFPGVNGTRFLLVNWAPASLAQTAPATLQERYLRPGACNISARPGTHGKTAAIGPRWARTCCSERSQRGGCGRWPPPGDSLHPHSVSPTQTEMSCADTARSSSF